MIFKTILCFYNIYEHLTLFHIYSFYCSAVKQLRQPYVLGFPASQGMWLSKTLDLNHLTLRPILFTPQNSDPVLINCRSLTKKKNKKKTMCWLKPINSFFSWVGGMWHLRPYAMFLPLLPEGCRDILLSGHGRVIKLYPVQLQLVRLWYIQILVWFCLIASWSLGRSGRLKAEVRR